MLKKFTLLLFIAITFNGFSQTLTFTDKANMITARSGSSSATDGLSQYIINGFSKTQEYTTEIEKYNYSNNSWSVFSTSIPTIAKRYGNAEIVNGKLYVFNGKTAIDSNNNKLEIIDLATGNLTYGAINPFPVSNAGSAVHGNDIYFIGGNIKDYDAAYSKNLYKYNTVSNQWKQLTGIDKPLETTAKVVNNKLYTLGGYSELNKYAENFETVATTGNLVLSDWMNVSEAGTKVYQGKTFENNKFAQISAFDNNIPTQEASNISWLISPEYSKIANTVTNKTFLKFDTKDGFNNGATLEAYIITNWTGNIATSAKTLLPGTIASGSTGGYATDFTNSGAISLGSFPDNFRIAFKYTGGYSPLATTTYQIDNVRIYSAYTSPYIESYDITTNTWNEIDTELPQPVSANALAVDGDKIFISGDYSNQSFLGIYDVANDTFTEITPVSLLERRHHNVAIWNNSLYLFGGNKSVNISTAMNSTQSANLSTLTAVRHSTNADLGIYPNPVNDILYFSENIKKADVFTVEGKKTDIQLFNNSLDVSALSSGIYFITGEYRNGKTFSSKIIKE